MNITLRPLPTKKRNLLKGWRVLSPQNYQSVSEKHIFSSNNSSIGLLDTDGLRLGSGKDSRGQRQYEVSDKFIFVWFLAMVSTVIFELNSIDATRQVPKK